MKARRHSRQAGLHFLDGDDGQVDLGEDEAAALLALTGDLDEATVSACPDCRSRVVACVALRDLLLVRPSAPRAPELAALAEDAPTLHVYVVDGVAECAHDRWFDPGYEEWSDAVGDGG